MHSGDHFVLKIKKQHFITAFILIFLLLGLLGTTIYQGYKSQFIKLQKLRAFPEGELTLSTPQLPLSSHVVLLGDSRMSMWKFHNNGVFSVDKSSPLSLPTINLAVGGTTSSQTLLRIKNLSWSKNVRHIVIIESGINDLHWLGGVDDEMRDVVVNQLKYNLTKMSEYLVSLDQTVVMMTVWPPGNVPLIRKPFWPKQSLKLIDDINQHIKGLAKVGVTVWEAGAELAGPDGMISAEYIDSAFFLHINKAGYETLSRNLPLLHY